MRRPLILIVLGLSSGCGWNYAQRTARPRPASNAATGAAAPAASTTQSIELPFPTGPRTPRDGAQVVPGARDLLTLGQNHWASGAATTDRARRMHAFEIERADASARVKRIIHCTTARTLDETRRMSGQAELERLRAMGIPPGVWVLRVDPTGTQLNVPNNDWFRHISKYHHLEFIGRHRRDQTVLYRYVGPREAYLGDVSK